MDFIQFEGQLRQRVVRTTVQHARDDPGRDREKLLEVQIALEVLVQEMKITVAEGPLIVGPGPGR